MITSTDIEYEVRVATDASDGDYDVAGIVEEILERFGRVDIGTIDHDEFWGIVMRHAIDTVAHYEETGQVYVVRTHDDGSESTSTVGYFDADGGEWEQPVADLLSKTGYRVAGSWGVDGDDAIVPVADVH